MTTSWHGIAFHIAGHLKVKSTGWFPSQRLELRNLNIALMLTSYWTNLQVTGDLSRHGANMTSLYSTSSLLCYVETNKAPTSVAFSIWQAQYQIGADYYRWTLSEMLCGDCMLDVIHTVHSNVHTVSIFKHTNFGNRYFCCILISGHLSSVKSMLVLQMDSIRTYFPYIFTVCPQTVAAVRAFLCFDVGFCSGS